MSDFDDNIESLDLFDEEFDKDDVVNRSDDDDDGGFDFDDKEEDDGISKHRTGDTLRQRIDVRKLITEKDLEPEDFINYDDEIRKGKDFRLEYKQNKDVLDHKKRLQENFKDFLLARRISGKKSLSQYKSRLPADILIDSGSTVQIEDEPDLSDHEKDDSAKVIINRDEYDQITNIIVHCSCGKKTKIEFDYDTFSKQDIEEEKTESILDYDRYIKDKDEMDIEFENKKELIKQKNMKETDKQRIIKNTPKTKMYEDSIVDEMDDVIDSKTSSNVVDSEDIDNMNNSDADNDKNHQGNDSDHQDQNDEKKSGTKN